MTPNGSTPAPEARRALAESAGLAEIALDQLNAVVGTRPGAAAPPGFRWLQPLWSALAPPLVAPADQVRRACVAVDDLVASLGELSTLVPDPALLSWLDTARTWSDRLWTANRNGPAVMTELRAVSDLLMAYRRRVTLDLPIYELGS